MNNTITNTPSCAVNFNGKLVICGNKQGAELLKGYLSRNSVIREALERNQNTDICAFVQSRRAAANDLNHHYGEPIYKVAFSRAETSIDRFLARLGLKKDWQIFSNFHSFSSTKSLLEQRLTMNELREKLDLFF